MRILLALPLAVALAQQPQNPSPMVEHTRAHTRLTEQTPKGRREKLDLGTLYLPPGLNSKPTLLLFFHGDQWITEVAAQRNHMAAIGVVAGNGSGVYTKLFEDPHRFLRLVHEAETKGHVHFSKVILGGWSAGCGALREILKNPASYARVNSVICIDGIHSDYGEAKPGVVEPAVVPELLQVWLHLGHDAMAGRKHFVITHSEIFPGTYASTTETADFILRQLKLQRRALLKWGPMGMQQLSQAQHGKFLLMGYAGDSAPDHIDQLQALPTWVKLLR